MHPNLIFWGFFHLSLRKNKQIFLFSFWLMFHFSPSSVSPSLTQLACYKKVAGQKTEICFSSGYQLYLSQAVVSMMLPLQKALLKHWWCVLLFMMFWSISDIMSSSLLGIHISYYFIFYYTLPSLCFLLLSWEFCEVHIIINYIFFVYSIPLLTRLANLGLRRNSFCSLLCYCCSE